MPLYMIASTLCRKELSKCASAVAAGARIVGHHPGVGDDCFRFG